MKPVICLVLVLLAAVLECHSYGTYSRWGSRGYRRPYGYRSYYRRRTCQVSGCSPGYTCRRRDMLTRSSRLSCLPDIRATVRSRLTVMETAWNMDDFNGFLGVIAKDAAVLPANQPFRRGTEGFAEYLAGRKVDQQWGDLKFTLEKVEAATDDFVSAIGFFEMKSALNPPALKGNMDLSGVEPFSPLEIHPTSTSTPVSTLTPTNLHVCGSCGKTFSRKDNKDRHTASFHGKTSVKCKRCPKQFSSKRAAELHSSTAHGPSVQCEICFKSFSSIYTLKKHKQDHDGNFRLLTLWKPIGGTYFISAICFNYDPSE